MTPELRSGACDLNVTWSHRTDLSRCAVLINTRWNYYFMVFHEYYESYDKQQIKEMGIWLLIRVVTSIQILIVTTKISIR